MMKVAVIGAGPSGITTVRRLREAFNDNVEITVYESCVGVGGMWRLSPVDQDGSHSSAYESLMANTPPSATSFSGDFPLDPPPGKLSRADVFQYVSRYAAASGVDPCCTCVKVLLGSPVTSLSRSGDSWLINGSSAFDAVAVCSGHHWIPRVPRVLRAYISVDAQGSSRCHQAAMHAHHYRSPGRFKGMRVAVFGAGISGNEILTELSANGADAFFVSRRASGVFQEYYKSLSVECFPFPRKLRYVKGKWKSWKWECDFIIACTGYTMDTPFLSEELQHAVYGEQHDFLRLYQRVVFPPRPTLGFIGYVSVFGSLHPMADAQARFFAHTLSGALAAPSEAQMLQEVREWHESRLKEMQLGRCTEYYRFSNVAYQQEAVQLASLPLVKDYQPSMFAADGN